VVLTNRSLDRPVREVLPLAVPLHVDALEPDEQMTRGGLAGSRQIEIPAERDGHVAVQLHLDVIQFPIYVRRGLPLHVLDPRGLGIDLERFSAVDPPVAVGEDEGWRERALE